VEPVLRGRAREPEELIAGAPFLRVALPFIAGYFVSYVYRMANAVLGPTLAAEFGLTAGGLGLLSSVYFLSFAVFQVPLGVLLDRFGPRRVNAALLVVAALGAAGFALAHGASSAIAARAVIGLGVSACLMASFTAYVLWYPPEKLAMMNAITFSAGAVGAMVATVPLELLLRVMPWRQVFMLFAACTVAVSLLLWLWVPERNARPRDFSLADSARGLATLLRDPAFLRLSVFLGASQYAAVALQTLWIAPWLRDVAGYSPAGVARGLLAVNVSMIVGYLGFGRAAEALTRKGHSLTPLLVGGIAASSAALGLIALGSAGHGGLVAPLWCVFVGAGTAVVLGYSLATRRYPKEMAGRVNAGINVFGFFGMFTGQWAFGLVLDRWPQTPAGYAPQGYPWALALLWAVQLAGLVWFWTGRDLFAAERLPSAASPAA
jgi:predicted MFS family arabinose efflux permease